MCVSITTTADVQRFPHPAIVPIDIYGANADAAREAGLACQLINIFGSHKSLLEDGRIEAGIGMRCIKGLTSRDVGWICIDEQAMPTKV
jgi:hypothetical protein